MREKIYYDREADLKYLKNLTVCVVGYGIQGRAQALNLRDSGVNVIVANRKDKYHNTAVRDGFRPETINKAVRRSDIILFLIPDQAQKRVYEKEIRENLKSKSMLIFAHGYALLYRTIVPPSDIDVAMLAPRMPGKQIRESYLKGKGVAAFLDVVRDKSGLARQRLLALSKAIGFTRSGVLEVSHKAEAELDLFAEQFLISAIIKAIDTSFKVLVDEFKYPAVATLMELYASSELAEVLAMASKLGIGTVFQKNASPTCQYGIASTFDTALGTDTENRARKILKGIKKGKFAKSLDREANSSYRKVKALWKKVNSKKLVETQVWINKSFK